jgi:uncharacterized protein YndB with AHSA1/START domain
MIELRFERDIHATAERIFALLVNLPDYDRWLPRSTAFHGTTSISEGPMRVGTTYLEQSPFGVRHGTVTGLSSPTVLNFEQPMTLKPPILGGVGIKLFHTLTPQADSVHLLRRLELTPHGPAVLLTPFVTRAFRAENERLMNTLKTFAEGATGG